MNEYEMSFEGAPACRWVKMFRGKRYRVSCAELGTPATIEASGEAANQWWKRKQAELEGAVTPKQAFALRVMDLAHSWQERLPQANIVAVLRRVADILEKRQAGP
jgi:hypothetical protein